VVGVAGAEDATTLGEAAGAVAGVVTTLVGVEPPDAVVALDLHAAIVAARATLVSTEHAIVRFFIRIPY